jgi:hypothetical protein
MATIDKSLPNTLTTGKLPGPEEVQQTIDETNQPQSPDVQITPTEDGGAEISYDPGAINKPDSKDHFSNLAEILNDSILGEVGSELKEKYEDYKFSRQDWEQTYIKGLDLLGFTYKNRTEPFRNSSGATHPVLAEAVTQFQAQAYKELLPAEGPVRTQIMGKVTPEKQDQANRVKDFMNYQIMDVMKEYEPEFDQMLFYLPLTGSTFKKVYYDSLVQRAVSKFISAEDLIVPYTATSLDDADTIIHVIKITENELKKQQVNGFYKDVELGEPTMKENEVDRKQREIQGIKMSKPEDVYTLLECHTYLDIEGFEDVNSQGEETGIKLPYVVTIEENSGEVLSIRRNYKPNDPLKNKINYFVHFKFLPGLGFYGFGLIHMIGGLSRTATQALRQLIDAGTLANLPAGFKMRGIRVRDDAQPVQPGEFRDVDAPGGNLKDAFMMLPFKEPSQTLLQLMGMVVAAGQRFAGIADMQVGDGNQQAAVGTTVALLERGSRVMSSIHKRLYAALKNEFALLSNVFKTYLPPVYPYDVIGGQRQINLTDFTDNVAIIPVADPNIFSQTQRITLAQTEMQMAMSNPQIHNMREIYKSMYQALGVKDIDVILPPPQQPQPMDPSIEHINALSGQPFMAFTGQDHQAHIDAHLNFMGLNLIKNNPMAMAMVQKNIFEHISLMSQEQVQLEFKDEIMQTQQLQQQMQQMQAMSQGNPQVAMQIQQAQDKLKHLNNLIESRKSLLIAEMTKDYMEEENKVNNGADNDPLIKIKNREIDLKALENERKKQEAEERINLNKLKIMSNHRDTKEKLEHSEDLAKMKAGMDLAKQGMQHMGQVHIINEKNKLE